MFKKKAKIDTTNLISLVVSDDVQVANSLKRILTGIKGNWKIYTIGKSCLSFPKSSVGVKDDFSLELKFKDDELKKIALASSEIFIATLPDEKGYYDKYKIYTFLKHLKISVPIYSMLLPFISEESVLYSLMNRKRVDIDSKKVLQYEARLAIDRLVKFHTNEVFKQMLPIEPNLESNSAIILDFIDSLSSKVQYIRYNGQYDYFTLRKGEELDKTYSYSFKKLSKAVSLQNLLIAYSKLGKWVGSVKALIELYSKGLLSYPTNSKSTKAFVTDSICKKVSDKSWGIYAREHNYDAPLSDMASDILATYGFLTTVKSYRQNLTIGNNVLVTFPNQEIEGEVEFLCEKNSLGVSQKELAMFFEKICLPSKLWVYQMFLLCKNGLVVEVSDTSYCLTALGKLVLQIIKEKIPRLLNEKSVSRINEGVLNITDEESRYDFLTNRWDRINIEITSIDNFNIPKVKSRCDKCGTRLALNVTDKTVFVRCQNPKCSNDAMLPITIKKNQIYAKE